MGEYTPKQNFYLIDGEELVNVETDLNYNLNRADTRFPPLISYLPTDEIVIETSDLPIEVGFKWWKKNLNSVWTYSNPGGPNPVINYNSYANPFSFFDESSFSFAANWASGSGTEAVQYTAPPLETTRWRGKVYYTGAGEIPANTEMTIFTMASSTPRPLVERYAMCTGGDSSSGFQLFRIKIKTNGEVTMIKYGGNALTAQDKYISLDIRYIRGTGGAA